MSTRSWMQNKWTAVARRWEMLYIERHGNYSVERLYRLKLHSERASGVRVVLVVVLTPLLCLVAAITADLIPLERIEKGIQHSHMFWFRTFCVGWYISFTFVNQCRHFIVELPMATSHVAFVASFVSMGSTAITIGLAHMIGFPLPFYQVLCTPGWLLCLGVSIFAFWGRFFRGNASMQRALVRYALVVMVQVAMTYVYQGYIFVFKQLTGYPQVACACLLPLLKLLAKNWINYPLLDAEDGKPEFITFNVEIFHALFAACCMQNSTQSSTSHHTTIVITVIDFVFATKSLLSIWKAIEEFEPMFDGRPDRGSMTNEEIAAAGVFRGKVHYLEAAIYLLENDPALLQHRTIRVRSDAARQGNNRIHPNAASLSPPSVERGSHADARIDGAEQTVRCTNTEGPPRKSIPGKASTMPRHLSDTSTAGVSHLRKEDESQQPQQTPQSNTLHTKRQSPLGRMQASWTNLDSIALAAKLTDDDKRAVLALSDVCRLRYVQQMLRMLHWTEFLLLVEFTEVVIPVVYCVYLWVAFRLPNRAFYAQLRDIDEETLHKVIINVLVYAALQGISLVFMVIVLHFKLRFSAMRQLAFVLESQWQQVQAKLILWVVFSIQSALDHFGADFTFQFAWLHHPQAAR